MEKFTRTLGALLYANPILLAILFFVGIVLIIWIGMFAIPIILIILTATGIHWYNQPRTTDLQQIVQAAAQQSFPPTNDFRRGVMMRFGENTDVLPTNPILEGFAKVVRDLYEAEDVVNPVPPVPPPGEIEEGRYRDRLIARAKKMADASHTLTMLGASLVTYMVEFTKKLPAMAHDDENATDSLATVPLLHVAENVGPMVQDVYDLFATPEIAEAGLFSGLRAQLNENLAVATGSRSKPVWPRDSKLSADELVGTYLAHTPFAQLFDAEVPFNLSLAKQLEHQMVVGGTRWGKSQLMGSLIHRHLSEEDPPGLIVIDSQGDFLTKISKLSCFHPETGRLKDRLLIINPEDRAAPALNMFDISALRAKGYSPEDLETVEAEVIHLFSYVFASMASELTGQQSGTFPYLVRLLLSMPGSNIHTLKELLEDKADSYDRANPIYKTYIEKLDPTAQDFFKNQYYSRTVATTRQAIARRLYGVITVPAFERMFAGANKVDFAEAMNEGKIIVVNTSKGILKDQASALFGRYIIARVLSGAFERVTIPMHERRPCVLFVDEAQEYFDDSMDTLLTQIAKFKLGICIAFQYVDQLPNKLRSSVIGNTTVKYVGGVTFADARYLAREMRVTEQMVLAQRKDAREPPQWAQFATYVRNYTPHALSLTVPFYALENAPQMNADAYARVLQRNRDQVASPAVPQKSEPPQAPEAFDTIHLGDASEPPAEPAAPPKPGRPAADPPPRKGGDELPTTW